jgi:glycosyltransferase involved in cell wall biosynthesis
MTSCLSFWKQTVFYLISKAMGRKTVLHLHGGNFMDFFRHSSRFTRFAVRFVFSRAEAVIVLSQKWRRFLQECVTRRPVISVIPNGVLPQFIEDLKKDLAQSHNRKIVRILFVGHLTERKGVFEILRAIPEVLVRHPDAVFTFAGPEAVPGVKRDMESICSALGCEDHVEFLGEVHGVEKANAFLTSSLFLLPSHIENLSVAILEAMCAGLPIITTRVGANTDILQEGRNCLFVPLRDSRSIAKAVCSLLGVEQARLRMGMRNRELFERRFRPARIIQQLGQLYSNICAGDCSAVGKQIESEAIADVEGLGSRTSTP